MRPSELVSYYDYIMTIIIMFRSGLYKAGLRYSRDSAKCDFRDERIKNKFGVILLVYNLMIRLLKKRKTQIKI